LLVPIEEGARLLSGGQGNGSGGGGGGRRLERLRLEGDTSAGGSPSKDRPRGGWRNLIGGGGGGGGGGGRACQILLATYPNAC